MSKKELKTFKNIESNNFIISYIEFSENLYEIILENNKTEEELKVNEAIIRVIDGKCYIKKLSLDGDTKTGLLFQKEIQNFFKNEYKVF